MSCIKFPSISSDTTKTSNEEDTKDCLSSIYCQLIDTANNEFGKGNWSHSITNQTIDFIDYVAGKYHAGCATIVKLQLKNGIFHEGMGYSNLDGSSKGLALQKARLNSLNMALAQVLLCFGYNFSNKVKNSIPTISLVANVEESKPIMQKQESVIPKSIEGFDVAISMSQTDALMHTVDLDQLYDKSSKSNDTKDFSKDLAKTSVFRSTDCSSTLTEKDKNSNTANSNNVEKVKTKAPTMGDISQKADAVTSSKKENKEVPKSIIHTGVIYIYIYDRGRNEIGTKTQTTRNARRI